MISSSIFFITFILYFISFFLYIVGVSKEDKKFLLGYRFALISFILHTMGLIIRYYEAGVVELNAYEKTTGSFITGFEKLKIMLSHPPFTNLYESMIFIVWGITLIYLILNRKYSLNIIGLMGSALVVIGMGLSNLLPDKSIAPLIPALKSWWLHIHVITASLSYGAFLVAAIVAFLYLIKDNTPYFKLLYIFLITLAIFVFMLISFNPFDFGATLLGVSENGRLKPSFISIMLENHSKWLNIPLKKPAPHIGITALIIAISSLITAIVIGTKKIFQRPAIIITSTLLFVYLLLLLFSTTSLTIGTDKMELASIINFSLILYGINPSQISNMNFNITPPYRISLNSYPYHFTIILLLFLVSLFFLYLSYKYEDLTSKLPPSDRLDTITYRTILFAFPMMTFVILTGAVWAHYAWGRYWGWDPKETWSLITWLVYAFYLHSRHILKWNKRRSAIISIIGFIVVIFTYIGVNLGLTGTGLHVYGSQ